MQHPVLYSVRLLFAGFLAFFFQVENSSAQLSKHGNIWHFGNRSGLDFTSGLPVPLSNVNIDSYEGCTVYCDANGQMLFYSNGGGMLDNAINGPREGVIWNRLQQTMYSMGMTEGGGYSAAQSCLVLPKPGNPDQYYLFTMDHSPSLFMPPLGVNRGLSYFIIDMAANGGLGAVTVPNVNVFKPATECLTAIPNSDGTGFWVITVDLSTKDFLVVPVTAAGVGTPFQQVRQNAADVLVIKASPDGKLLCANGEIYNFDAATGQLTLREIVTASRYNLSFSPGSRYLYTFESDASISLVRYDMAADSIGKTSELLTLDTVLTFAGLMQIGPDGNIYFIEQLEEDFLQPVPPVSLSVIRCPDGTAPKLERAIFKFPTDFVNAGGLFTSLPNFADYIFAKTPERDTSYLSLCGTNGLQLSIAGPDLGAFQWSTGDTIPSIFVQTPGTYEVIYGDSCTARHSTFIVSSGSVPFTFLVPVIADSCAPFPLILHVQTDPDAQILWSDGSSADSLVVLDFGTYSVKIQADCGDTTAAFTLLKPQKINPEQDSVTINLCNGEKVTLQAAIPGDNYLWSTGATTQSIEIQQDGIYSVVVEAHCVLNTSVFQVSVNTDLPTVKIETVGLSDTCKPSILLRAVSTNTISLKWQNGSTADTLRIEDYGTYSVTATGGCGNATATYTIDAPKTGCCHPALPNVFTPNGDGVNDVFGLLSKNCDMEYLELNVYSRWGELMFQSIPNMTLWDGTTLNGTDAGSDVYVYTILYKISGQEEQFEKNQVTLLR